ncbi:MAG TPA: hypothetical protein VMZ00_15720, partial [Sporichthya sp.]|nr:hypothetical protein [Sporichthya sp.]
MIAMERAYAARHRGSRASGREFPASSAGTEWPLSTSACPFFERPLMSDFVPGLEGVIAFESEIAEPD